VGQKIFEISDLIFMVAQNLNTDREGSSRADNDILKGFLKKLQSILTIAAAEARYNSCL